jgi:hypothetical protein
LDQEAILQAVVEAAVIVTMEATAVPAVVAVLAMVQVVVALEVLHRLTLVEVEEEEVTITLDPTQ